MAYWAVTKNFFQPSFESISLCSCLLDYCLLIINEVSVNIYMYIFTFRECFTTYAGFLTKWVILVGHYLNLFVLLTVYIICVSHNTEFDNWNLGVWYLTMSSSTYFLCMSRLFCSDIYCHIYLFIHPISEQTSCVLSLLPGSGKNSGEQKLIDILVRSLTERKK